MRFTTIFYFCFLYLITLGLSNAQIFGEVEKVADGFQFVEGPVWKDGALLFSDIPANKVYKWTDTAGISEYLNPSGNSNGLALDSDGNLLLAQHGLRQVARLEEDDSFTPLANNYDDKKLNSPNDMDVKSDGSIFFTDPPYGINSSDAELDYNGVYRIGPTGQITLLERTLYRPNGIAFSPDEKTLYVGDAESRKIFAYDVVDDSTLANKRQFAAMSPRGYTDGMKTDKDGRLFSSGPIGIWVYEPDGTLIETIEVPGQTTNCGWGDADGNTLYITSGDAVYRIRNTLVGVNEDLEDSGHPDKFKLFHNYPNPFNATTNISFTLKEAGFTRVNVLNTVGEKLETLSSRVYEAGRHSIIWDADNINSGVYIIQLSTISGTDTRKCILLK